MVEENLSAPGYYLDSQTGNPLATLPSVVWEGLVVAESLRHVSHHGLLELTEGL